MAISARTASTGSSTADNAPHRALITVSAIGATLLQSLDQTIANVALPYMQGSFSASYNEITWVLTSYITAAAIMTAPVGWLATRFGRKPLYIICIVGFTIASMLCGAAQSLAQIVAFRVLQGLFSAALVPLSQVTLMDIYPLHRRGFAMAIWGMGVMIGPIMGPTLGGYLTEHYNWRWVFYINLPFGVLAAAGLLFSLPNTRETSFSRFDWFGFGVLSAGIGGLQLMLDRGQTLDWFSAREIIVEAILAGLGFYLFIVHLFSARQPLLQPRVFKDINFLSGLIMMFAVGTLLVSSLVLITPWLQILSDYPVQTAGLVLAPRGLGNLATIMLSGRLVTRMDPRFLVAAGLLLLCGSFYAMTGWTPDVSQRTVILTVALQGAGLGLAFMPLQMVAFATLEPALRTEGSALFALLRNIGAAIGVSVCSTILARNTQALHQVIGSSVTPFNRALMAIGAYDPATRHGAAMLDQAVNRQAEIIAYMNDYVLLICTTLPALLLLLLMRRPPRTAAIQAEPLD
jgi:MFS transporter, DHA2 family, multidrug resistance protein